MKYTWIDPPNGWKYGFPKKFRTDEIKDKLLADVCIENGYPKKLVIDPFLCWCWEEEINE